MSGLILGHRMRNSPRPFVRNFTLKPYILFSLPSEKAEHKCTNSSITLETVEVPSLNLGLSTNVVYEVGQFGRFLPASV